MSLKRIKKVPVNYLDTVKNFDTHFSLSPLKEMLEVGPGFALSFPMKNLFILTVLITTHLYAAPGFFDPNDPNLPPKLRTAANSVFEVKTAFFEDYEEYTDLEAVDLTEININDVFKAIDASGGDKKDNEIKKAFVKKCKTPDEQKQCIIPTKIGSGSGFITGSGNKLWTNAHVMERMLKTKADTNDKTIQDILKSKTTMPIFIFDKNGNMIFNGLEEEVSFASIPHQTELTRASNSFYNVDSDYLAIQLPRNIGTPLKVVKKLTNDNVAIIGYPTCTGCDAPDSEKSLEYADRAPFPNAEDCLEKVTGGKLISPEIYGNFAQINQYVINSLDRRSFIAYTADSQYGMSGGPLLNFEGEVVGIHSGGKSIETYEGIQRYSRGVVPPDLLKEP